MFTWLKNLFTNPKEIIRLAISSLDSLVPLLAKEIEKTLAKFNAMSSTEKAQFVVDQVQAFLMKQFKLDA